MKLNEENVESVYQEVRAFFKGGVKAVNKTYDQQIDPAKSERVRTRSNAGALFPKVRDEAPTALMLGDVMRDTGNTWGNCYEAASVAASYFKERMPDVKLTIVTASPGDHDWLIVGEDPGKTTVRAFAEVSKDEPVFAVDVWAGICCRVGQYPDEFQETMGKWQDAGKRVVTPDGTHQLPVSWGNGVFESQLRSQDPAVPYLSGKLTDRQTVLSAVRDKQEELESLFQSGRDRIAQRMRLIDESPGEFLQQENRRLQRRLSQENEPEESRKEARSRLTLLETDSARYIQGEKEFLTELTSEVGALAAERERLRQVQRDRIGLRQSVPRPVAEAGSLASGSVQSSAHKRSRSPLPLAPQPAQPQGASAPIQHNQSREGEPPDKKRRLSR